MNEKQDRKKELKKQVLDQRTISIPRKFDADLRGFEKSKKKIQINKLQSKIDLKINSTSKAKKKRFENVTNLMISKL